MNNSEFLKFDIICPFKRSSKNIFLGKKETKIKISFEKKIIKNVEDKIKKITQKTQNMKLEKFVIFLNLGKFIL